MKKILILATVALLSIGANAQKFGHIDSQELMSLMPGMDSVQDELKKEAEGYQTILTNLEKEFNDKLEKLQNNPPATDFENQRAQKDLEQTQNDYTQFQQTAQNKLMASEERLMQPLIDLALKTTEEVGQANGFTYIFDSSVGVLLYSGGGEDVLPLVKEALGIKDTVGE